MTTVVVWFVIVYVVTLPVRIAGRARARRVTPPPVVVVVVQQPAVAPQPLTLDEECARIQARDGIR
ncbi:hypothetical protein [Mycobacterium sp.]|jgi:hypothetical protein|uniref:hypothetical protein n=1 Tax=Mycobacterium sp. TaxID=1785 RepID=UPI003F9B6A59